MACNQRLRDCLLGPAFFQLSQPHDLPQRYVECESAFPPEFGLVLMVFTKRTWVAFACTRTYLMLRRGDWTRMSRSCLELLVLLFGADKESELTQSAVPGPFVLPPNHSFSIPVVCWDFV